MDEPVKSIFIYVHTPSGNLWLQCDTCKTSSPGKLATSGVSYNKVKEWVDNHICSSL